MPNTDVKSFYYLRSQGNDFNNVQFGDYVGGGTAVGDYTIGPTDFSLIVQRNVVIRIMADSFNSVSNLSNNTEDNGYLNTSLMEGVSFPAAQSVRQNHVNGFDDWYIPSIQELIVAYNAGVLPSNIILTSSTRIGGNLKTLNTANGQVMTGQATNPRYVVPFRREWIGGEDPNEPDAPTFDYVVGEEVPGGMIVHVTATEALVLGDKDSEVTMMFNPSEAHIPNMPLDANTYYPREQYVTWGGGNISNFPVAEYVFDTLNAGSGYNGSTDWQLPNLNDLTLVCNSLAQLPTSFRSLIDPVEHLSSTRGTITSVRGRWMGETWCGIATLCRGNTLKRFRPIRRIQIPQ